ncbi:hypothetical protein LSCM1_02767 [Leishmania martiniquensis]|uniref:Uncharacterized protein n=1 Tax=Leishmania martiniquensis TaxID=1580590 RepID=A0A836GA79_9TRYP|nr:hypothetical protein LSCM1_02767 [Leishmania martiniquensis]
MQPGGRKRGRSGSSSPPLAPLSAACGGGAPGAVACALNNGGSLFASCGLLRNRQSHIGERSAAGLGGGVAAVTDTTVARQNLLHLPALQEVLRRTSLAEMRDREVVEFLHGAEQWLRELSRPLQSLGASGSSRGGLSSSAFRGSLPSMEVDALLSAYRSALSELRLLVLGVLHTMPWWRVVETVACNPVTAQVRRARVAGTCGRGDHSNTGGGGRIGSGSGPSRVAASYRGSSDRSVAAVHAITRWHVRLQIAFERVCLTLIDQSQQTVRGVLEVLLKPCQLRPPVRDGARRSIPSDSFIRVLNAVATKYGASYVVELLEGCIADFMPRRRWVERRHHVACTAVLLYLALEGHTPAYHSRLGNSQSLQRAVELLKSLRSPHADGRGGAGDFSCLLPSAMRSYSVPLPGGTSEESGTDMGGWSSPASVHQQGDRASLSSMLPTTGVLPAGYVSATLLEGARAGEAALRQQTLPRPSLFGGSSSLVEATTTASETEISDSDAHGRGSARPVVKGGHAGGLAGCKVTAAFSAGGSDSSGAAITRRKARFAGEVADQLSSEGASGAAAVPGSAVAASAPSFLDVTAEHNNKLLSHRNEIVRVLLNRLLDVELTLEPKDAEEHESGWSPFGGVHGLSDGTSSFAMALSTRRATIHCSPFGSPAASGLGNPAALLSGPRSALTGVGGHSVSVFPSAPLTAGRASSFRPPTAASSGLDSPSSLSTAALLLSQSGSLALGDAGSLSDWNSAAVAGGSLASSQPLEHLFNTLSQPYLRILRDCATLVYGRLADDLRRQQGAGSCGNADWWMDIVFFYLTVVARVDRPVYLLYLAPSLSMRGTEDESVGLLHKLITLVIKGSIPVEQPRSSSSSSAFGRSSATWASSAASSIVSASSLSLSAAPVQPVRLRMAPPAGTSRRVVTMEERLRAARHIFPLFRFLQCRIDETSGEGVRRRLLKWTAQELRRLGGSGGCGASALGSTGGPGGCAYTRSRPPPSREARLALITFAQCAAISELMGVDVVPQVSSTSKSALDSTRFTASTAYGDTSDGIAAALEPLLKRYTLQNEVPADDAVDAGENDSSNHSAASLSVPPSEASSSSPSALASSLARDGDRVAQKASRRTAASAASVVPSSTSRDTAQRQPRRRIDLRQMEFEGLLQPQLMAYCPWQAWLR